MIEITKDHVSALGICVMPASGGDLISYDPNIGDEIYIRIRTKLFGSAIDIRIIQGGWEVFGYIFSKDQIFIDQIKRMKTYYQSDEQRVFEKLQSNNKNEYDLLVVHD